MVQDMKKLIDEISNKGEIPCPICKVMMPVDNKFCSKACFDKSTDGDPEMYDFNREENLK